MLARRPVLPPTILTLGQSFGQFRKAISPLRTYGRGMNRIFPLTLILAASLAAAAPAGAAAPKFKADVYIHQSSEWAASWTTPEICGDGYRHFFRGDGSGAVTYKAKGVPVTFKKSRGPGGVNHAGEGEWDGRWTLKLTRVR